MSILALAGLAMSLPAVDYSCRIHAATETVFSYTNWQRTVAPAVCCAPDYFSLIENQKDIRLCQNIPASFL